MDIRVAAYGVIIDDGRMLLAHWSENGKSSWTLPGGGIDPGEDPADAARREILEETGFMAQLDGLIGVDSRVIPASARFVSGAPPLHALRIVYAARVVSGELQNEANGSTDRAAWFDLAAVASLKRVAMVDAGIRFHRDSGR
ncbi:NUDIX hydrolase [Glaciihabitans sp. UYNi722]|uniref:NUDIX hydrolase n=1 Tax=Glaciihabitans sp. UYNi722 TaxID=3156344 RepID=UPI003397A84C